MEQVSFLISRKSRDTTLDAFGLSQLILVILLTTNKTVTVGKDLFQYVRLNIIYRVDLLLRYGNLWTSLSRIWQLNLHLRIRTNCIKDSVLIVLEDIINANIHDLRMLRESEILSGLTRFVNTSIAVVGNRATQDTFLKSQGDFFLSFPYTLFYIFLTPKNYKSRL